MALSLAATLPTTGDLGLTWDEPAYKESQVASAHWWRQIAMARSRSDLEEALDPDTLAYHWPYARFGINFHPPLAGQVSVLTCATFGRWMKDIPARRLASVLEYSLTMTILFGFLASRYGPWVGGVAAASLLLMPRVYGDGHVAGTDMPGLLIWAGAAACAWKGLNDPNARRWRVLVGVLLGLAFVEKMGTVAVLLPIVGWLVVARLPGSFGRRADWVDGIATTAAMLIPLGLALAEVVRLTGRLPPPVRFDPFDHHVRSPLPGAILLVPLFVWLARRLAGWALPRHPVWGAVRPALEIWTAILAFAPAVGWLGNPYWWRETLPRLAHYAMLNGDRRGALPDIRILYLGRIYEYSLPWHNAWVLIAVTVPVGILAASAVGVAYALRNARRDRLPLYFLIHLATLPVLRMLPTPAHDGVRLFLPTFFFLAAMAGWGLVWASDGLAKLARWRTAGIRVALAATVLGSAGWGLVAIHPFELSYYSEPIGGPTGAWRHGFELTYWYDAFNARTLDELGKRLPKGASVASLNELSDPPTFQDLQALGALRGDLDFGLPADGSFPFAWLLTHDSKASAFTRLLFAMRPWYERRPGQLGGLRVATVADPSAVSRALALELLASEVPARHDGNLVPIPNINEEVFAWSRSDPEGLLAAAKAVARGEFDRARGRDLLRLLARHDDPKRATMAGLATSRAALALAAGGARGGGLDPERTARGRPRRLAVARLHRPRLGRRLPRPRASRGQGRLIQFGVGQARRGFVPRLADDRHRQQEGDDRDGGGFPVGGGRVGEAEAQEVVRQEVIRHPRERLRRGERPEDRPLVARGGDAREQALDRRVGQAVADPHEQDRAEHRRPAPRQGHRRKSDGQGRDPRDDQPRLAIFRDEAPDRIPPGSRR